MLQNFYDLLWSPLYTIEYSDMHHTADTADTADLIGQVSSFYPIKKNKNILCVNNIDISTLVFHIMHPV